MNKFLIKLSELSTGYNVNYNSNVHHADPYHNARMRAVDDANEILSNRGFTPSLEITSADLATAKRLQDMDFAADHRPLEASANRWSALGGILGGGATGIGLRAAGVNPILSSLASFGVGVGTGVGIKNMIYSPEKSNSDNISVETNTNKLLDYLSNKYTRE
jgi:hypothetical protein